jgi:UDP-N-acetylglucosamine:LPS N-acetylglucosamine transferase
LVKVFSADRQGLGAQMRNTHHTLQFLVPGDGFLEALLSANVVVSALGTTTFELAFLKVPSIFIPVAPNQKLNASGVAAVELGLLVNPSDGDRASQLVAAVERSLSEGRLQSPSGLANLDGLGALRILDIISN